MLGYFSFNLAMGCDCDNFFGFGTSSGGVTGTKFRQSKGRKQLRGQSCTVGVFNKGVEGWRTPRGGAGKKMGLSSRIRKSSP
jgi:hypothetical protein